MTAKDYAIIFVLDVIATVVGLFVFVALGASL
jgi:hypothetical protein